MSIFIVLRPEHFCGFDTLYKSTLLLLLHYKSFSVETPMNLEISVHISCFKAGV